MNIASPKRILLPCLCALLCSVASTRGEWRSLFDGKTLQGWKVTDFGGHGEVKVENGQLLIETGAALTGVHWPDEKALPKVDYEISLEAMKVSGEDFFCGLTFPVRDSFATLIVGGWGGGVVGISSIDNQDASENETTKFMKFEAKRWYAIRVRVTDARLEAWIDQERVVNAPIAGRKISLRPGEIEISVPLGLATYQVTAAMRNIQVRTLDKSELKRVALIAGAKSHGPGEHEYEEGLRLFKECLETSANVSGLKVGLHLNGWPEDAKALDDADTIVLYCDGSDRDEKAHPLLRGDHLEILGRQMKRGAGLVAIHYAVFVPKKAADAGVLEWLGGYFDYETGNAPNKWYSKIETREYETRPTTPGHPLLRGVYPFKLKEEYYFNMRLRADQPGWTPIVMFGADASDVAKVVAWAVERPDGGRGFGYTGGHFHKNWEMDSVRRLLLNAILWTAKADLPAEGVKSRLP